MRRGINTVMAVLGLSGFAAAQECTKYISSEGAGNVASLQQPARDLGDLTADLQPGDVICITGGTFTGGADSGSDSINVPVDIYGGFSPDFSQRDPWGDHRTVFTGVINSATFSAAPRLMIDTTDFSNQQQPAEHRVVIDGIIFDNGPRNQYVHNGEGIVRAVTPDRTPTPESSALVIRTGPESTVIVRHVIAMNTASLHGAIALFPGAAAAVTVENSVAVNNTGTGFQLSTSVQADDPADWPRYNFTRNTSVFNQMHTAAGTSGGSGISIESGTHVSITGNILAFNDSYGINNARRNDGFRLLSNAITGNGRADYLEGDTRMSIPDILGWSQHVQEIGSNVNSAPQFGISADWGALYVSRYIINSNAAGEDAQVVDAHAWSYPVRDLFGWNLIPANLHMLAHIWLPRMSVEDAVQIAVTLHQYGPDLP